MCSIRNLIVLFPIGLIGCQPANVTQTAALSSTPILEDEAMKMRNWAQSSAMYPNGQTVAGPTLFDCEPQRGMEEWTYYYADPTVYAGNMVMLPYRFFAAPINSERIYPGEVVPPSFTAIPAMPPEVAYPAQEPVPAEEASPAAPVGPVAPAEPATPADAAPMDAPAPGEPTTQPG